ncbi:CdaR family transcriptional regulator [Paraliobacillus sp. JSM ZJ581]|uniref:CdaR family transcriptional regulator n=1 Tax=Paraliobacillus sp. JSM ZJ581 TaxID=3342118 RepID=UPI0035A8931F
MLTEQLASAIVKRTMSIIDTNVNVMDWSGTIIASGDTHRIGQLHDGARKVMEQNETVEISSNDVEQWIGSLPGINLPICFRGKIVGVIGITGEPEQIRSYSQLVQMGAELTLEQAALTKEIERNERLREDVISHLILGSDKDKTYVKERAQSFKINTNETYAVILISIPYKDNLSNKTIKSWINSWLVKDDELVKLYNNQYIVLKMKRASKLDTDEKLKSFVEQKLDKIDSNEVTIAVGPYQDGVEGWRKSYEIAQRIVETATMLYPQGGVWNQHALGLSLLCYQFLREAKEESNKISENYRKLFFQSDGEVLHETFLTFVKENGEMTKTADKLFIHRNTLAYRLEKIHTVTGRNPKNLQDLVELTIGQVIYELSKKCSDA